ncbi:hypothetical protein Cycma_3298 [Cyclobacterium marinum DSM 745]|uniref:Uncharacterized protein n=1 Tax=Cyclobacterium marinum (strain ATCC 25205 / DSM 745 / LMG 13164 / NCIMB 1802) TaxID=880070 RepID=G0IV31_CYCMS|nr:hypothetical protein Cycma_3298 [Cyclobacterium marinum DSM 745]
MSSRKAILIQNSSNGRKAIYVDAENADQILAFFKSSPALIEKFKLIIRLILEENRPPRDLYDKENFEKGCEYITAMKPLKGKNNPRVYCQQFRRADRQLYVIVMGELLEKKSSQGLSKKEKQIIRRVASYEYEFED